MERCQAERGGLLREGLLRDTHLLRFTKGHSLTWATLSPPDADQRLCSFANRRNDTLVFSVRAVASHLAGTMNVRLGSLNSLSHPDSLAAELGVSKASSIRMLPWEGLSL